MKAYQLIALLFLFWVILSPSLLPFEIAAGLALASLLGIWAARSLWVDEEAPYLTVLQTIRLAMYLPYLVKEIVIACIHVAVKVLDPRLPIDPVIMIHESPLEKPLSRVALASSITLTPGTLTVDLEGSTLWIHCLGEEFSGNIRSGRLEKKIARVFEEG